MGNNYVFYIGKWLWTKQRYCLLAMDVALCACSPHPAGQPHQQHPYSPPGVHWILKLKTVHAPYK